MLVHFGLSIPNKLVCEFYITELWMAIGWIIGIFKKITFTDEVPTLSSFVHYKLYIVNNESRITFATLNENVILVHINDQRPIPEEHLRFTKSSVYAIHPGVQITQWDGILLDGGMLCHTLASCYVIHVRYIFLLNPLLVAWLFYHVLCRVQSVQQSWCYTNELWSKSLQFICKYSTLNIALCYIVISISLISSIFRTLMVVSWVRQTSSGHLYVQLASFLNTWWYVIFADWHYIYHHLKVQLGSSKIVVKYIFGTWEMHIPNNCWWCLVLYNDTRFLKI